MHTCVCVCDICLTVAAVAVFITLCIRDRPSFRHYIISPDQHVSLRCTGCHKSDKLEIHTKRCPPPPAVPAHTPACILHHTEIIVEFVAIRMRAARRSITVLLLMREVFGAVENVRAVQMFSLGAILHFASSRLRARYRKHVLIIFLPHAPFFILNRKGVW